MPLSVALEQVCCSLHKTTVHDWKFLHLQVRLLFEMLNVDPWCYYPLTVQLLSTSYAPLRNKCLQPPAHVAVTIAPMEVYSQQYR